MAAANYYSGACMDTVPKHLLSSEALQRVQTEQIGMRIDHVGIAQGRIMWLPAMEELPERAVRRAHGKGAVEDGIYNHPVVIVSRPLNDERCVHFHLITSLQGKKLDQLYPKSNEFHTSRRSWYLPISPSPDHPDAGSKKAKKRFPTLALADGATLRWDSYVNIRHVYKIDWTLLKPYSNVNTPRIAMFQLERDSLVRMIAKGKILTLYEPSEQMQMPALQWISTAPPRLSTSNNSYSHLERGEPGLGSPDSDHGSVASRGITQTPANYGSDFRRVSADGNWSSGAPQGEPPDPEPKKSFLARVFNRLFTHHQRERSKTRP